MGCPATGPKFCLSDAGTAQGIVVLLHRERLHQDKFSAYGLNKLVVMFMPRVPGKTRSHLQWILQAVTNKSSHLFITLTPPLRIPKFLSLLCVHEPPPRMRIILLSDIPICFCGGERSLQVSRIDSLFLVRGDGKNRSQVRSSGPPQERKTRECERRTLSLWSTDKLAIPKSTQRRLQAR